MARMSPPENPEWTARRIALATLVVLGVAVSFWLLLRFRLVLFSLFEAVVFGTVISPLVGWFERRGLSRTVSIGLTFLVILSFTGGFFFLAAPLVINQFGTVIDTLRNFYQNLRHYLLTSDSLLIQRLALLLPLQIVVAVPGSTTGLQALGTVSQVLGIINSFGSGLFAAISVLLLTFYWILDREKTVISVLKFVPENRRAFVRSLYLSAESRVGAFLRGVALLALTVALMALVGYLIIGLPHAFILGLIAGVLEVVPIIGPILGAIPAIAVSLSAAPEKLLAVIIVYIVIQIVENNILVPRIMNRSVGVSPVVSLLAFAGFSSLFGIAGALLAIPMAVLIQILLDRLFLSPEALYRPVPKGRDRVSVLRYQAQVLVQDVRKRVRVKEGGMNEEADLIEDGIESIVTDLDSILSRVEGVPQDGEK
ncbi:MAG: AI-2E family transporter [Chloroflexi bacterium]|nr:AI-2E family transporter [Chloroflexota bacterium]